MIFHLVNRLSTVTSRSYVTLNKSGQFKKMNQKADRDSG